MPCFLAISPQRVNGSTILASVVPAVAQIMTGRRPLRMSVAIVADNALGSVRPRPSVTISRTALRPMPAVVSDLQSSRMAFL